MERYFVSKSDDKDYVVLDLSPGILNADKSKLTTEQRDALGSFDKLNILAFRLTDKNRSQFQKEVNMVSSILKDEKYEQLMKFGHGQEGVTVKCVGDNEHINEFVLFANRKENGFAIVRVLGEDMNPRTIINLITVLRTSDLDWEQLKPIQNIMN